MNTTHLDLDLALLGAENQNGAFSLGTNGDFFDPSSSLGLNASIYIVPNAFNSMDLKITDDYQDPDYRTPNPIRSFSLEDVAFDRLATDSPAKTKSVREIRSKSHRDETEAVVNERRARVSSEEDKDAVTPAQTRRKAQNRAAQRAFRERKERHVRELEARLTSLTKRTLILQSDNERLKRLFQRIQTENEILRSRFLSFQPLPPTCRSSGSDDPSSQSQPSSAESDNRFNFK